MAGPGTFNRCGFYTPVVSGKCVGILSDRNVDTTLAGSGFHICRAPETVLLPLLALIRGIGLALRSPNRPRSKPISVLVRISLKSSLNNKLSNSEWSAPFIPFCTSY